MRLSPLNLTDRGEKLSPDQLRVVMDHPTYGLLVGLQEPVYAAIEAEQKADHALQEARRRGWKEGRERLPCPLQRAYAEAQERSIVALEAQERVRDQIQLARIAGIPCPEKADDLDRAVFAYRAAIKAELTARKAAQGHTGGFQTVVLEDSASAEQNSLLRAVEVAREATRFACTQYGRVAYTSELRRFVDEKPRTKRPEKCESVPGGEE